MVTRRPSTLTKWIILGDIRCVGRDANSYILTQQERESDTLCSVTSRPTEAGRIDLAILSLLSTPYSLVFIGEDALDCDIHLFNVA